VRTGEFYPQALEKGLRREQAWRWTLAEMDVQGVSTRKVAAITEQLCGVSISSSQVSRATAEWDAMVTPWRERPLGRCPYWYLDARYETVRQDGQVRDAAGLIASGVQESGQRQILGVSVSWGEPEVHGRTCLQSLVQRGLSGALLIISDAPSGLQAARRAVFGGLPWQRCQVHLQQHAQAYVPRQALKTEVAADIRAIFNAPDRPAAEALLAQTVTQYRPSASKLADWLETHLLEGLTVFAFPQAHRRLIRTPNSLARLNREIRRRTRVVTLFPNEAACLRLVSALLMEVSEAWESGRAYLTFPPS